MGTSAEPPQASYALSHVAASFANTSVQAECAALRGRRRDLSNPEQPQQPTPQQQPQPLPLEHQQWLHEQNMRAAERAHDGATDFAAKTNTAAIEAAYLALRTAMLINGGAAISVLAFIGGLASRGGISLQAITQTAGTLIWFAAGVALATLSMGFRTASTS